MAIPITDADDPRLDDIRGLVSRTVGATSGADHPHVIAEGMPLFDRLVKRHEARAVYATARAAGKVFDRLLDGTTPNSGCPVFVLGQDLMSTVMGFDFRRGVIATFQRPATTNWVAIAESGRSLGVLEGVGDPENLGAICRSALAFGLDGVLLDPRCGDPYYRRSVRVSMGAVMDLRIGRVEAWPEAIDTLNSMGLITVALTTRSTAVPIRTLPPGRTAILLGNESSGLSRQAIDRARVEATIATSPLVDSLNVGHASAIAFHHLTGFNESATSGR